MKILSPQQQKVVADLLPVAQIATDGSRKGVVVTPRVQTLIIGSSGSGKSYVAAEIASQLSCPCLKINVGSWILMASRTSPNTWSVIAEWLANLKAGGVIILDEIDKLTSAQEYTAALRLEIHDLLDNQIPPSLAMPTERDESFEIPAPFLKPVHRDELEKILQAHVMIIACGAFQDSWQTTTKQIGFGGENTPNPQSPPTRQQILSSINPELRQRFRAEISVLPPMSENDYFLVGQAIAAQLSPGIKREWDTHLGAAVARAVEANLGMRIFEELILKAMIEAKKIRSSGTPIPESAGIETGIRQCVGYAPTGC